NQHRGCHASSENITKQKIELARSVIRMNQVAIIAAHRACGLVVVMDLPARVLQVLLREQGPLDPRRQLQISLERALLLGGQVVEAETDQGIGDEPLFLD